jgi:glycosyltransferase 2 family protein
VTTVRALAAFAGLLILAALVWAVGPEALVGQIRDLSWRLPLILLPYAVVAVLDAAGWRYAFPGRLPPLPSLVVFRLAGEAVNITTPTITLGGEPVKAWLASRAGIPLQEALVSVVVAKTALVLSHVAVLAFAVALAIWRIPLSPPLLVGMSVLVGLGLAAIVGFVWALHRGVFGALGRLLARLGAGRRTAEPLRRLDDDVVSFYRLRRGRFGLSCFFHFLGWMAGSYEVWLVLRFVDAPVDILTAIMIEAFGTAIRSATFLIPASLGVQEGGFVAIFLGLGLSATTAVTYGLVRRIREAAWSAVGYAFVATGRRSGGRLGPGPA